LKCSIFDAFVTYDTVVIIFRPSPQTYFYTILLINGARELKILAESLVYALAVSAACV